MDMVKWLEKQRECLQRAHDDCKDFIASMMKIDNYYMITENGKKIHRVNSEINQVLANLNYEIDHLTGPRIFVNAGSKEEDNNGKGKHDKGTGRKKTDATK